MFAKRLEIAVGLAIQRLRLKIDGWKASRARKKALKERVRTLRRGAEAWNRWRRMNPSAPLDLPESRIRRVNLYGANLSEVNLGRACFDRVDLRKADLSGAGLSNARFLDVDLREANLSGADLSKVIFSRVDLRKADLSGANRITEFVDSL